MSIFVRNVGLDGDVVLLECSGDTSWEVWIVYAAQDGFKRVAVPARLLDAGQISAVRSGVASYRKLDTLNDLKEIVHATLGIWELGKAGLTLFSQNGNTTHVEFEQ